MSSSLDLAAYPYAPLPRVASIPAGPSIYVLPQKTYGLSPALLDYLEAPTRRRASPVASIVSASPSIQSTTLDRWQYEEVRAQALKDADEFLPRNALARERLQEDLAHARVRQAEDAQREHLRVILNSGSTATSSLPTFSPRQSEVGWSSAPSVSSPPVETPQVLPKAKLIDSVWISAKPCPLNAPVVSNKWGVRWYSPASDEERWGLALPGNHRESTFYRGSDRAVQRPTSSSSSRRVQPEEDATSSDSDADSECDALDWPTLDGAFFCSCDECDSDSSSDPKETIMDAQALHDLTQRTGLDFMECLLPADDPAPLFEDKDAAFFARAARYAAERGLDGSVSSTRASSPFSASGSVW